MMGNPNHDELIELTVGELRSDLTEALESAVGDYETMIRRAAQTLRDIADCDEEGHTGMTWAQNEARQALKDIRSIGDIQ